MAMGPEEEAEAKAEQGSVEAHDAERQHRSAMLDEGRFEAWQFSLELVRAVDDPPPSDPGLKQELHRLGEEVRAVDLSFGTFSDFSPPTISTGELRELISALKVLGPPVATAIVGYATAWVQSRNGRKVRLKIGEIEAEARTTAEVEHLLFIADNFSNRDRESGDQE